MKKIMTSILLIFTFSQLCLGQSEHSSFIFQNKDMQFVIGDTVRITYDLDSLEILHSNFGGCGTDAVYFATCHTDLPWSLLSKPYCDYLLTKYYYSRTGSFEIMIDHPGIYSISFYVKNQNQKIKNEDRFKFTITTQKFEIKI